MSRRTTATEPIRVDFVPLDHVDLPGRLGLTFAPGKKIHGLHGLWDRDLPADLDRLRAHYRTDVLLTLIEPHEFDLLRIPDLAVQVRARGMAWRHFPIRDVSVPVSLPAFAELVESVVVDLHGGRTVVVHCRGGLGRAGLTAASCLVRLGHDAERAIASVRLARRGTVETSEQEAFVHAYGEHLLG